MSDVAMWGKLLFELGLAVWDAIENGDDDLTVGEIFADRKFDMDEISRLEDIAREYYEG